MIKTKLKKDVDKGKDKDADVEGLTQGYQNDPQFLLYPVVQLVDKRFFKVSCHKKSPLSQINQRKLFLKTQEN